jgi:hypothetical protein
VKGNSNKAKAKKEVGDLIVNEILRSVEGGNSPVSGYGKFKKLNKDYAKEEKGGNRTANLDLEGDMLNALVSKNKTGSEIEFGIFKAKEVGKADGHNNFSGDSTLPVRRFVPDEDENLKRNIEKMIVETIAEFQEKPKQDERDLKLLQNIEQQAVESGVALSDVLGTNFLDDFLNGI